MFEHLIEFGSYSEDDAVSYILVHNNLYCMYLSLKLIISKVTTGPGDIVSTRISPQYWHNSC